MKLYRILFATLLLFCVEVSYSQTKYKLYEETFYKNGLWGTWQEMSDLSLELYADFENGNANIYLSQFIYHPSNYSIKIEMRNSDLIATNKRKTKFKCNNAKLFYHGVGNLEKSIFSKRDGFTPRSVNAEVTIEKSSQGSIIIVAFNNVAYAFTTSLTIKQNRK